MKKDEMNVCSYYYNHHYISFQFKNVNNILSNYIEKEYVKNDVLNNIFKDKYEEILEIINEKKKGEKTKIIKKEREINE